MKIGDEIGITSTFRHATNRKLYTNHYTPVVTEETALHFIAYEGEKRFRVRKKDMTITYPPSGPGKKWKLDGENGQS